MSMTADSARAVFDHLIRTDVQASTTVLFDTVCVMGGSIAGLLAARVLADHARSVLIVECDVVSAEGRPRQGVPQDRQGHGLLPGGRVQIERWLPGFTREAQDLGAVLSDTAQQAVYLGDERQKRGHGTPILTATRPFLESRIRHRVLALANVSTVSAQVTGLDVRDGSVRAVQYLTGGVAHTVGVDFVVDAMGRSSKLSNWVEQAGYQRPELQRFRTDINYATALFERSDDSGGLGLTCVLAEFAGSSAAEGLAVGAVTAVEDDQWQVGLMAYEPDRPPASIEALRSTCAKLPPVFGHAVSGRVTHEIRTYRQADSRRRNFTGQPSFPARLVSVGDAVASFNPIYGQGISSAALHASCLSGYLVAGPELSRPASEFFEMQAVVTDAAWALSTGGDAARLDANRGAVVPHDVARERWTLQQLIQATSVDETVAQAFQAVTYMLAHPSSLAEPALVERAIAANRLASAPAGQ